jgi:hypothetical protein
MKATFVLVACALVLSSAAWADKVSYRKQLEESLKLTEERLHELQAGEQSDARVAKDLFKLAEAKVIQANQFAAQAKAFNDSAALSTGAEKFELEAFAKEMQTFADHDRVLADERKKAADIINQQVQKEVYGEQNCRTSIERIKAKLAAIK